MSMDRRRFLGVAGVSALALAGRSSLAGLVARVKAAAVTPSRPVRWAMVIDAQPCRNVDGCTDCIAACHRIHNVPRIADPRHEVKWVWKAPFDKVFPDEAAGRTPDRWRGVQVPVLCNHCDNPPCVRVCPTKATWKRDDGVVMMDYHRCIGCRYCAAACPYGSRSFNFVDPRPDIPVLDPRFPTRTKGVVEKCNFCEERLAAGQAPACVEACPARALVFGDLNDPASGPSRLLADRYSIRRRAELGTGPQVYYLV
jgi:Fe-S-cluster-containing dehydrogenase component